MIAAFQGAKILQIQAPSLSGPSLCSLDLDLPVTAGARVDPVTGIRRCELNADPGQARFTDYIHPEQCVLVRRVESYDRLSLHLSFPSFAERQVIYKDRWGRIVLNVPAGTTYGAGRSTKEQILFSVTVRGNAAFGDDGRITVFPGKSELVFVGGSLPGAAYEIHHPPGGEEVLEQVYAGSGPALCTRSLRDFSGRQSAFGGVVHDTAGECIVCEQYDALRFFLQAGLLSRARAVIEFFLMLWRRNGLIPYAASSEGEPLRRGAFPASVSAAYPVLCAKAYYDTAHKDDYIRGILPTLSEITRSQVPLVRDGHLPFNGCEAFDQARPVSMLVQGSRHADRLFVASADALSELAGRFRVRIKGLAELCRLRDQVARAQSDYTGDGPFVSYPGRALAVHLPRECDTYCESCARGEQLCLKDPAGRYLCAICYAKETPLKDTPFLHGFEL